jgi:hypothetical protein
LSIGSLDDALQRLSGEAGEVDGVLGLLERALDVRADAAGPECAF